MPWNWELPEWPKFEYDATKIALREKQFLLKVGSTFAFLNNIHSPDYDHFVVEILSSEGLESFRIEGEVLDRESLQSSIKKHFGLTNGNKDKLLSHPSHLSEAAVGKLLYQVCESYEKPLTKNILWDWHKQLFEGRDHDIEVGCYRSHEEPMQIISRQYDKAKVFYEAPPSCKVEGEMSLFIKWFNESISWPVLERASVAHVYFESIHPFEDGNGRIGRLLVEKILSQGIGRPALIAVSKVLEKEKKGYYAALERGNKTLKIDPFLDFFSDVILKAQENSIEFLFFLISKSKIMSTLSSKLNKRQEKVLLRMFAEGVSGFKGGLSADNYLSITKTSRATATRDLADLVLMGALEKTGELRHTRYFLNLKFNMA